MKPTHCLTLIDEDSDNQDYLTLVYDRDWVGTQLTLDTEETNADDEGSSRVRATYNLSAQDVVDLRDSLNDLIVKMGDA